MVSRKAEDRGMSPKELEELLNILYNREWSGEYPHTYCESCNASERSGHLTGCRYLFLIARLQSALDVAKGYHDVEEFYKE